MVGLNDKVYFVPSWVQHKIGKIDPANDDAWSWINIDTNEISVTSWLWGYRDAIAHPTNGRIYFVPRSVGKVIVLDTTDNDSIVRREEK